MINLLSKEAPFDDRDPELGCTYTFVRPRSFATVTRLQVGTEFEVVAPPDGNWTSVMTMTRENGVRELEDALANADRVGFTFGDCESFGHGARATATVRFRVLEFRVE